VAPRLIAPLSGLILASALYPATFPLDAIARGQLGPGFWPRVTLIGLGLACAARLVREWRRPPVAADPARPPIARGTLAAAIALIVLYVGLAPWLGFPLVTAAFVAAFMALGGARSVATLATGAVVGTAALLYVFVKVVYLPLPKGDGPFEALTLAVYRALGIF
jgi:putative tricarboxylic transport membrane protein